MMYDNYDTEAEIFLGGDYLHSPSFPELNVRLHQRILGSIAPTVLREAMRKNRIAKKSLDAVLRLGEDGRRIVELLPNGSSLDGCDWYRWLKNFLETAPEYLESTGILTIEALPAAVLTNTVCTGRRLKLSRQLLRTVSQERWAAYAKGGGVPWPWCNYSFKQVVDHLFAEVSGFGTRFLITTNLLDFLLSAQEGACDFGSCHSLDGEHALGNVTYALNDFTAMIASIAEVPEEYPYRKRGRQWIQFANDYSIVLTHRRYGNVNRAVGNAVLSNLLDTIAPEDWLFKEEYLVSEEQQFNSGNGQWNTHGHYPVHFDTELDCLAYRSGVDDPGDFVLVYPPAICLKCGKDITSGPARFKHLRCSACGPWALFDCPHCATPINPEQSFVAVDGVDWHPHCARAVYDFCANCPARALKEHNSYVNIEGASDLLLCSRCVITGGWVKCKNCPAVTKARDGYCQLCYTAAMWYCPDCDGGVRDLTGEYRNGTKTCPCRNQKRRWLERDPGAKQVLLANPLVYVDLGVPAPGGERNQ